MEDTEKDRLQGQYDTPGSARSEDYGLTRKQIRFAEEYISTNDATHALLEAGYAPVKKSDGDLDRTRTGRRAQQYQRQMTTPTPTVPWRTWVSTLACLSIRVRSDRAPPSKA